MTISLPYIRTELILPLVQRISYISKTSFQATQNLGERDPTRVGIKRMRGRTDIIQNCFNIYHIF